MSAPWTLRHAVDINRQTVRVQLLVDDTRGAGRLLWQLVALGGTVDVTPTQDPHGCRHCSAPVPAHCPGCGSCAPGYRCSLLCDADPADVDQAVTELVAWENAERAVVAVRCG